MLTLLVPHLAYNPKTTMPGTEDAWCAPALPRNVVVGTRTFEDEASAVHEVELLQHTPLVAAVRGFATGEECAEVVRMVFHAILEPGSSLASE